MSGTNLRLKVSKRRPLATLLMRHVIGRSFLLLLTKVPWYLPRITMYFQR